MKRIFCLILVICLFTSLSFAELPLQRQNYIVERHSRLYYLIPSTIFGFGSYLLWQEAEKPRNEDTEAVIKMISGSWALISLIMFFTAITPKKTYLFPKIDKEGTIWFEKEVIRW